MIVKKLLDENYKRFNQASFIEDDPISIPHRFTLKQDVEITAFWTSMLAWGQRKTIINKSNELFALMDNAPYDFIKNHSESDRKAFENFKHRTFQATDTIYFLHRLQRYYKENESLEQAFIGANGFERLKNFHDNFFDDEFAPQRTRKHVSTPIRKSSCKRLNMFLRWMVRQDTHGVDFGIWKNIKPSSLMIPLDVHVDRIARKYNLLKRKQRDWNSVEELTSALREFDPMDPVKYDFALFGMGVIGD